MSVAHNQRVVVVEMTDITCGKCGAVYALSERYRQKCYQDGTGWHCPYCQVGWGYLGNTEVKRLQAELRDVQRSKQWAEERAARLEQRAVTAEHQARAQKAAKTRLKNRIGAGVCPCCTRSFENLQRHMKNQHPEFRTAE